jgi:hypothetical protein
LYIKLNTNENKFDALCHKEGKGFGADQEKDSEDLSSATLGDPVIAPMNQVLEEK